MKNSNQKQIDSLRQEIKTAQLQEDIAYCIDDCNLGDEMIGNVEEMYNPIDKRSTLDLSLKTICV